VKTAALLISLLFVGTGTARAQTWYYGTPVTYYYSPSYAPTVSYYGSTYATPMTTYYAPATSYYSSYYAPYTSYYAPATSYYSSYYAPAYSTYAPVTTYYSPGVVGSTIYGTPQVYVPGQPVRNVLRSVFP
jgi:hypothetical protein